MGHLCLTFIPPVARKFTFYQLTAVCPALSFRHQISVKIMKIWTIQMFFFFFCEIVKE